LRFANGLKGQLLIGHGFLPILDTEVPALKKTRKSPSRAVVLKPVRYPNRYRHLLRSTGVTFDFFVSLDYSLTVNPLPDCKFPPSTTNSSTTPNQQAHGWLFVLHSIRRNYAAEI